MKVKFIANEKAEIEYIDLTVGRVYNVIGIESDYYRLLNDQSQPYLYPPDLFEVIEAAEPADWETEFGEDGERYAYPVELNAPGFFEDYFDGKTDAIVTFHRYLQKEAARQRVAIAV
jgi:hypothetical protein